jgi:hypothetical protein
MNRAVSENPLGLGLLIVGALATAIAAFLPLDEPTGAFHRVEDNTLIQHGGWMLIVFALAIAVSGYRVSQGKRRQWWVPTLLCAIAAALIVLNANDESLRTLYPIGSDGVPDTSQPGKVADLGVAIYVAGAGIAAALIGSLMLRQREDKEETRAAPTLKENRRLHESVDQARPQAGRQRSRLDLQAEAEAAEAEALAAQARARAIRLRRQAEAKANQAQEQRRQAGRPPAESG